MDYARFLPNPQATSSRGWGGTFGDRDFSGKIWLQRVKLDRGGYDENGRYYGVGAPLWKAENEEFGDGAILHYLRAADRAEAKRLVREMYPKARFFR